MQPNAPRKLKDNDIVRFGTPISKGVEVFSSCTVSVKLHLPYVDSAANACVFLMDLTPSSRTDNQPVVYRVPDDSDVANSSDDEILISDNEEDVQIQHSSQILRDHDIRPAADSTAANLSSISVDLTGTGDHATSDGVAQEKESTTGPLLTTADCPSDLSSCVELASRSNVAVHQDIQSTDKLDSVSENAIPHPESGAVQTTSDGLADAQADSRDICLSDFERLGCESDSASYSPSISLSQDASDNSRESDGGQEPAEDEENIGSRPFEMKNCK